MDFTNRVVVRKLGGSSAILLLKEHMQHLKVEQGDQLFINYIGDGVITLCKVPHKFKERVIRA